MKLEIRCFSRFHLLAGGVTVDLHSAKAEELLAFLACERGLPVSKSRVAETLWSGLESKSATNNLYQTLYKLKENAPEVGSAIVSSRGTLRLDTSRVTTDTEEFARLFKSDEPHSWERAVNLYRGILLMDSNYDWAIEYEGYYDVCYYELLSRLEKYYADSGNNNLSRYYRDKARE